MASRSAVVVAGREPGRQLVEPARGDVVAGQADQLVLAREVGVDRARPTARSRGRRRRWSSCDSPSRRRPGLAASRIRSRTSCSWAALTRGTSTPKTNVSSSQSICSLVRAQPSSLDKGNDHSLCLRRLSTRPARNSDVQPLGSVRLPLPPSRRPDRHRHRLASTVLATQASSALSAGGWLDADSELAAVAARLDSEFGAGKSSVIALFRSTTPGADATSAEFQGAIKTSVAGLSAVPEVTGVVGYAETGDTRFISTAGDAAYIVVELERDRRGSRSTSSTPSARRSCRRPASPTS